MKYVAATRRTEMPPCTADTDARTAGVRSLGPSDGAGRFAISRFSSSASPSAPSSSAPSHRDRLKAGFARAAEGEWQEVGSELEALLLEARLIHELAPEVNVQIAEPALETRVVPPQLVRDVVIVLPSIEPDSAEVVAAGARGDCLMLRTRRSGVDLVVHVPRLTRFFTSPLRRSFDGLKLAPIVFSWLADRGRLASRLDPHDAAGSRAFRARLKALLADEALFSERIVMR